MPGDSESRAYRERRRRCLSGYSQYWGPHGRQGCSLHEKLPGRLKAFQGSTPGYSVRW
jgi:hypothetical protein